MMRPHYVGEFAETKGGTVVVGVIAIPLYLKAFYAFILVFSLTFISIAIGTGTYALGLAGLGFFLIPSFFLVLNVSGAASEWEDIPRDMSSLFPGSTGGSVELRED